MERFEADGRVWSINSTDSILSINSAGSILSIGSVGSILSIGSALSVASVGSFLGVGLDPLVRLGRPRCMSFRSPGRGHGRRRSAPAGPFSWWVPQPAALAE